MTSLKKVYTSEDEFEYINKDHIVRIYQNNKGTIIIQLLNNHIYTNATNMDILAEKLSM